jgi:hypothetical protein
MVATPRRLWTWLIAVTAAFALAAVPAGAAATSERIDITGTFTMTSAPASRWC